jgi:DNA-3-methyladenine glycosylase II
MSQFEKELVKAAAYLSKVDPKLKSVIVRSGIAKFKPHKNYYFELIDSIIGQQLSIKAAASIRKKFLGLFDDKVPSPDVIIAKSIDELRSTGLSGAKAKYIQDLALHVRDKKLKFDKFHTLSNEEIITELTAVKGIGEWTAHMFLMFCMGRIDVVARGDLGIRNGIKALYGLDEVPNPERVTEIAAAKHWHPYESVACWYIWQSLDNAPKN